jgi:hypothetical protein
MDTRTLVAFGGLAFVVIMLIVLFYSVRLQRKAVGTQDSAVSKVDESLALSRESVELQRRSIAVAEQTLDALRESNRLLGLLSDQRK